MSDSKLRVIPLGGLGEIGKNMMVFELDSDIVVIDAGVMFPEQDMLGIDLVIPDIQYLVEHQDKLRAILITHGHEDHTGALPFILRQLKVPVYAPRLAHGLIQGKLKEHGILRDTDLIVAEPDRPLRFGAFEAEFFRVCHSIPDAMGIILRTPLGTVVHTGDFKLDHTPVDGRPSDFVKLAGLGGEGVLALMSDSTYAELEGYTPSEQSVTASLERIMAEAPGRVIVATFASLVSRIQQVADAAAKYNRKVGIMGRSMVDTVQIALRLGYLKTAPGVLVNVDQLRGLPDKQIALVTTGTQGEPTSALVRMANGDHREVTIVPGDTIIMSATPIPGNESVIYKTIDNLFRLGANVVYDKLARVHVHGHASQEELKMMISLTRPRFFVPVHGEYRHLALHAKLAQALGIPAENTFVLEDGDVLELSPEEGSVVGEIEAGPLYVDGLARWDDESMVLRDRRVLSRDGIVVVFLAIDKLTSRVLRKPEIVSYGFVDEKEAPELMERSRDLLAKTLQEGKTQRSELGFIHARVKDTLSKFYYEETRRRPLVLPVAMEL